MNTTINLLPHYVRLMLYRVQHYLLFMSCHQLLLLLSLRSSRCSCISNNIQTITTTTPNTHPPPTTATTTTYTEWAVGEGGVTSNRKSCCCCCWRMTRMTQQSTHHVLHRINATVMRLDRRPQGGGRGAAITIFWTVRLLWTVHVTIIIAYTAFCGRFL